MGNSWKEYSQAEQRARRFLTNHSPMTEPTKTVMQPGARPAVLAGFLGWTLDAFDFFVVVFLIDTLAQHFGVPKKDIVRTMTATLAMRPVGAVIFGLLSDRYGRRIPLMCNVIYFSVIELLCGFAPNYTFFFVMRALFGIGMGGEWGVGASLAMEAAPARWRGILSGILQSGYSIGYLLAAIAARFLLPVWGWRAMFWVGALPALLALYIRTNVPESEAWKQHRAATTGEVLRTVGREWKRFAYLVVLMTFMMFLSHGTQDLYPDFLQEVHNVTAAARANIAMLYNVGAVLGAIVFGQLSQTGGPAQRNGRGAWAFAGDDSAVGVWQQLAGASARRVSDAGGRAGRVGRDSGASQRAFGRCGARVDCRALAISSGF